VNIIGKGVLNSVGLCSTQSKSRSVDWNTIKELFPKQMMVDYASRLVRREMFSLLVAPGHFCLIEEQRLVEQSECSIRKYIQSHLDAFNSPKIHAGFLNHIQELFMLILEQSDYDIGLKESAMIRFRSYDLDKLFVSQ
jgi:hypothetical protein